MSGINHRIFLAGALFFVFFFSFFQSSQAGFFDWFKLFRKNDSQSAAEVVSRVQQDAFYTFSVSKSGSGVVISDDGKINCGKQCKASYPANSKIILKAEAGDNYKLERWNGCDKVSDGKCQTTLNKSKMIVAKFASKRTNSSSSQKSSSSSIVKTSSSKSSNVSSKASSSEYSVASSKSSSFKSFSSSLSSKSSSSVSSSSASLSFGSLSSLSTDNQYYLKITSPNGGENFKEGSTQSIKFTTNKFDRFITLKLYKNDNYLMNIGYYDIVYSNPSKNSENSFFWNVPSSLNDGEDYKIYATITNSKELYGYEISDWSDNVFTVKTGGEEVSGVSFSASSKSSSSSSSAPVNSNGFFSSSSSEATSLSSSSSENFITSPRTSIPWTVGVLVLDGIDQNSKAIEPLEEAIVFVENFSKFDITYSLAFSSFPHTYTKYDCQEGLQTCVVVNYYDVSGIVIDALPVADSYVIFWNRNNQPPLQAGSTWGVSEGIFKGGIKRPYATIPVDIWWYDDNSQENFKTRSAQIISHELINSINAKLETAPYYCAPLVSDGANGGTAYKYESDRLKKLTDDCYNKYP